MFKLFQVHNTYFVLFCAPLMGDFLVLLYCEYGNRRFTNWV